MFFGTSWKSTPTSKFYASPSTVLCKHITSDKHSCIVLYRPCCNIYLGMKWSFFHGDISRVHNSLIIAQRYLLILNTDNTFYENLSFGTWMLCVCRNTFFDGTTHQTVINLGKFEKKIRIHIITTQHGQCWSTLRRISNKMTCRWNHWKWNYIPFLNCFLHNCPNYW